MMISNWMVLAYGVVSFIVGVAVGTMLGMKDDE